MPASGRQTRASLFAGVKLIREDDALASEHSALPTRDADTNENAVALQSASAVTGTGRNLFIDQDRPIRPSESEAADTDRPDARTSPLPTDAHGPPALVGATGDVRDAAEPNASPAHCGHVSSLTSTVCDRRLTAGLGAGRPVSAYTARVLPARLTTAQRTRAALRALLADRPGRRGTTPAVAGIIDPIAFTLQARISPARRMRGG